jgi:hypothetical protein
MDDFDIRGALHRADRLLFEGNRLEAVRLIRELADRLEKDGPERAHLSPDQVAQPLDAPSAFAAPAALIAQREAEARRDLERDHPVQATCAVHGPTSVLKISHSLVYLRCGCSHAEGRE